MQTLDFVLGLHNCLDCIVLYYIIFYIILLLTHFHYFSRTLSLVTLFTSQSEIQLNWIVINTGQSSKIFLNALSPIAVIEEVA